MMPPKLRADVLRVLYEADPAAVAQIRKASEEAGVPTLVKAAFVGLPGARVSFDITYCPYGSSAFRIAPEYRSYLTCEGGRDYVIGDAVSGWPIAGGAGQYVGGRGAAVPGGPGPGFHFPNGFAPGASFCNDSNSPGTHF